MRLIKPPHKDEERYSCGEYSSDILNDFNYLCGALNNNPVRIDDIKVLIDMVYKEAYLDGFTDALYFKM